MTFAYGRMSRERDIQNFGCDTILLEVNTMNYKAISLYEKYGFKEYGTRKNYYGNSDAILMKKEL